MNEGYRSSITKVRTTVCDVYRLPWVIFMFIAISYIIHWAVVCVSLFAYVCLFVVQCLEVPVKLGTHKGYILVFLSWSTQGNMIVSCHFTERATSFNITLPWTVEELGFA